MFRNRPNTYFSSEHVPRHNETKQTKTTQSTATVFKQDSRLLANLSPKMNTQAENPEGFLRALRDLDYFQREMNPTRRLGSGSDGDVYAWKHLPTSRIVAIKQARTDNEEAAYNIRGEAHILGRLRWNGGYQHVANMFYFHNEFCEGLPAIITEFAEYGDLVDYRCNWQDQEIKAGRACGIREGTVWKLFRDMVLALDWLHNVCGFIHRDVKPDNILVTRPQGYTGELIPTEPVFKLCDFSRSWDMTAPSSGPHYSWQGTVAFRPSAEECQAARPASDLWSLGATLQDFALDVDTLPSRAYVMGRLNLAGKSHPGAWDETAWAQPYWRWAFGAVYRPLNKSADELLRHWDVGGGVESSYRPFSDELNAWYNTLFLPDYERRVTARTLAIHLVPLANSRLLTNANRVDSAMAPPTPTRRQRWDVGPSKDDENFPPLPTPTQRRRWDM